MKENLSFFEDERVIFEVSSKIITRAKLFFFSFLCFAVLFFHFHFDVCGYRDPDVTLSSRASFSFSFSFPLRQRNKVALTLID